MAGEAAVAVVAGMLRRTRRTDACRMRFGPHAPSMSVYRTNSISCLRRATGAGTSIPPSHRTCRDLSAERQQPQHLLQR